MARVATGDHRAFELLIGRHQTAVYRYCVLMVSDRDAANDVYQDVMVAFYRKCRERRDIHNVRAYLTVAAKTKCIDYLKYHKRIVHVDERPQEGAVMNVDQWQVEDIVGRALDNIPAQYKEAFVLFIIKEYSYDEISEILGVGRHVVKNRIYRARQALHRILAPVFKEPIDAQEDCNG